MSRSDNHFMEYMDFTPTCILEAGVGRVKECLTQPFWDKADCWLFEPLPHFFFDLAVAAVHYPRVRIFPVALWDHEDGVGFYEFAQSSWVKGITPRSGKNRGRKARALTKAPSARLSVYDHGQFDLALIDVESAELHVIRHMVSRPKLIVLEMWRVNKPSWTHPDYDGIMAWMGQNGYVEVGRASRDSFFKRDA